MAAAQLRIAALDLPEIWRMPGKLRLLLLGPRLVAEADTTTANTTMLINI